MDFHSSDDSFFSPEVLAVIDSMEANPATVDAHASTPSAPLPAPQTASAVNSPLDSTKQSSWLCPGANVKSALEIDMIRQAFQDNTLLLSSPGVDLSWIAGVTMLNCEHVLPVTTFFTHSLTPYCSSSVVPTGRPRLRILARCRRPPD